MIITLSGRRVKRPLKNFVPARGLKDWKKGRGIWTRQAKALAPWAGAVYSLTDTGEALVEATETFERREIFERRQSAYRALGMHWLGDVREIRRGYQISLRELCGTRLVVFEGASCRDSVAVQVTGDTDNPFDCCGMGREVRLPNVSFELAAQMWMAAREMAAREKGTETVTTTKTKQGASFTYDNEGMKELATVQLVDESGNPTEALTVPSFSTFEADEARGCETRTGGSLYTWKSVGDKNWLVAGRADVVDAFCFVVLPDYRGEYLDLADDEDSGDEDSGDDMDDDENYDN